MAARALGGSVRSSHTPLILERNYTAYPHWSLFEVIDEDLLAFSRQVEFAEDNFATYSIALLRQ